MLHHRNMPIKSLIDCILTIQSRKISCNHPSTGMAARHPQGKGAGMNKRFLASCLAGATGLALAACSERPMDIDRTFAMTPPVAHGTGAKTRLITTTEPGAGSEHGRVVPRQIVCAEASPDTASSISSAMTAAFSGSGSSQGQGISAQAAGEFGKAVAESLVQLGERTATIQLLRDGYHRACEAYANGAITDITYALIISRLDEVMVTMMTGELAAGAFGRKLAATSGNAGTSRGDGAASVAAATEAVNSAVADLNTATAQSAKADKDLTDFDAANRPPDPNKQPERARLNQEAQTKKTALAARQQQLAAAEAQLQRAQLGSSGTLASQRGEAAGGINASPDPQIAEKLVEMYDRFMEGNPLKKMVVACVTALDRPKGAETAMNGACETFMKTVATDSAKAKIEREKNEGTTQAVQERMKNETLIRLAQVRASAMAHVSQVCAGAEATKRVECVEKMLQAFEPPKILQASAAAASPIEVKVIQEPAKPQLKKP